MLRFNQWITASSINECVIAKLDIDGANILVKNRDRAYIAPIEIVHELIDGVEVVYLHDKVTDWSEGMNEYGIGIVNSALQVKEDEKEGVKKKKKTGPRPSRDGLKIRTALSKKTLKLALDSVKTFVGKDPNKVGVTGETIISDKSSSYLIEMTSNVEPIITKLSEKELVVRTNHGIDNPELGYTKGRKKESSHSRMDLAHKALCKAKSMESALDELAARHAKDNFMNPYRDDPRAKMHTTAQIGYDLANRIFYVRYDEKFGKFEGIKRNLPKGYVAKIQLVVAPVTDAEKGIN
jgi:hypothetical protein